MYYFVNSPQYAFVDFHNLCVKMAVKSELNTTKRKAAQAVKFCAKQERNATLKKVYALLKKTEVDRSEEEKQFLFNCIDLVKEVRRRIERQKTLKERLKEVEDPPNVVAEKCVVLAEALSACRQLVVYTGAGVSTAACIPDYRGSNGIWTLLQQGKDIGLHDLSKAEPTLTHMALTQLYRVGLVKHIVSQNCDGLHLRSGLPREALSEVHGNMYVEVCRQCQPVREYLRLFDVTESTARFNHRTGRRCYVCSGSLIDSIVHFGERGTLKWPLNWPGAVAAAANADAILCIGSSLKVLKRYPWLWSMDKHPKKRPKLYIVNLQWTPKDDHAVLKINARCDFVMEQVMRLLQVDIPTYDRSVDPIFPHATSLHAAEKHTTTKPLLTIPEYKISEYNKVDSLELLSSKNEKCSVTSCNTDTKFDTSDVPLKTEDKHTASSTSCTCGNQFKNMEKVSDICQSTKNATAPSSVATQLVVVKTEVSDSPMILDKLHTLHESADDKQEDTKINTDFSGDGMQIKQESFSEGEISKEPFMEIIYEGVKLKVEDNLSVQANVKINNDMVILCDMPSIHCNSFLFNSSYELEESENDFKFVNVINKSDFDESEKHYYTKLDSSVVHDGKNFSITQEIIAHSTQKMLLFFNPSEHNYSQMSSAPGHSSCSQSNVPCSAHNNVQMQGKSLTSSAPCKKEVLRKCTCCTSWYGASECLFYLPMEPVFRDSSAGICECCSEGSEDEEEPDDCEKKEDKDEAPSVAKPASNPGWYGKGYRKRVKKKR